MPDLGASFHSLAGAVRCAHCGHALHRSEDCPSTRARTLHVDRARMLTGEVLVVERWRGTWQHVAATVYGASAER